MPSTRKIIRAFLASPGDLEEERKAIRNVVDEFNESWADELGYQVELIGWEETVAGFGRPQHLINQDLDRCDLFLGMIWKRWGTPPDCGGDFSSGFEEEFERSMARREKSGSPEISLFFKQIPDEFMGDPGDDLKRVLEFRKKIIDGKRILFQNFSEMRDIETLARKSVTAYVIRVREDESSEPDELRAKRARSGSEDVSEEDMGHESSPLSVEGFNFLEGFVERLRHPYSLDELNASDVARFRLLANSISKPGNEEMNIGVHDINILFEARTEGMELGEKEKRLLTSLGFQHLTNENVPLWCWYSAVADYSKINPAVLSSVEGVNENEKVGAISVLTSLALELLTPNYMISRDVIIKAWFSVNSSDKVRTAALGYLAKCGNAEDLETVKKEYARSDYGTSRYALECMIEILLRTGQLKAAQELVLESQFESLNVDLLRSVLEGFEGLETSALLIGLEHRNSQVRLRTMKLLHVRGALNIGMAERLSGDNDALIRKEAIAVLEELGKPLTDVEIRKILVMPQKQRRASLVGMRNMAVPDKAGEELFQQYQLGVLKSLSEAELEKKVGTSMVYDDDAFFALVERYFRNHADELRRNVDDKFSAYLEERIQRALAAFGDSASSQDYVKKTRDLTEYLQKKLTRRGLNVLCIAQKPEDLQRIRANLRDGYTDVSKLDAQYLAKHGEWSDITMLANAEMPKKGATLLSMSGDEEFQLEVARAITSIGKKHSVSDLLTLEMPAAILKKTIELCAESRFARISRDALLALFNHESDNVRKAAVVLAVRAFPAKRIKTILHEYVVNENYRYYNIIHWLDLGASMRRDDAKRVARAVES